VVSAFGRGAEALWQGLLSGRSRVAVCPELGTAPDGAPLLAARVPDDALGHPTAEARTDALIAAAAQELTESPAWCTVDPARLGVCLGTTQGPIGRWTRDQQALADGEVDGAAAPQPPSLAAPTFNLARALGARGPVVCPSMACATSTAALGLGLDWIRAGACDAVVAGGVDALSDLVHAGFSSLKALDPGRPRPFDQDRAGLGVGEGAALLLLQRGAGGVARLSGWGQSADANHLTGPDPEGAGVVRAVRRALDDAGIAPEAVDFVSAHGTATGFNDLMEGKALCEVFGQRAVPVNSIKGAIGHTMAAAGAIEAVLCTLVLERGQIPATTGLSRLDPEIAADVVQGSAREALVRVAVSTNSGFGGINAAIVLERD
jgi:dodecanoy-ACP synthase